MPLPPITRFTSVDTKSSSTNNNNGLYAPELNQNQINAIPTKTKRNGGIWYNTDLNRLEAVVNNTTLAIPVGGGGGNVVGNGASTVDNIVIFTDNTSTQISDSGIAKSDIVIATGAANAGKLVEFTGVGKNVQESNFDTTNLVSNNAAGTDNAIVIFDGNTGKLIKDSTVNITQVPAPAPLLRASVKASASNITINEISNLGHLRFSNDLGIIFVDTLMPVEFITNNTGIEDQVCSLFTGGLPSSSTTPSALVELQSDSGALLLSRMTEIERDALITSVNTNGMLLFNTTSTTFDGFDGTNWRTIPMLNSNGTLTIADPTISANAATKNYVDNAISSIPASSIILTGNVTASGVTGTPINTTLNMTLDQIQAPIASLNLNNKNIIGLATPTLIDDAANKGYVDSAISGSGFAPGTSKYIIQTADAGLPNAQVLGSLTTGLLKNTTTTGILSIAVAGTDYYSLNNPTRILDDAVNFFIGRLAGNLTLSGTSNTGIGITSLESLTTGIDNTAAGNSSLKQTTSGLSNCAFGARALAINIAGNYNSAFGSEALLNSLTDNNSAFGYQSLRNNTSGTNNCSFGYQSLFNNLTGFECCSFGVEALQNSNSQGNSAFGYQSMQLTTSGDLNSAFGWKSLASNTTGTSNTSLGAFSLNNTISGSFNVACGVSALLSSTTSSYNSAFGVQSLFQTTTGQYNTGIGFQALGTNILGSSNTSLGYRAGYNQSNINNCLFLGYQADTSVNNITNAIAIGYQASVGTSNCMVLGGNGANQLSVGIGLTPNAQLQLPSIHANRKFVLYETANNDHQVFGLGTDANTFRFQINDSTLANYVWNAGTSATSSNELMRLTGSGLLGIGTATPNGYLQFPNLTVNRKTVFFEFANNDHEVHAIGTNNLGLNNFVFRFQIASTTNHYIFYAGTSATSSNELMRLTGSGLLGIGIVPNALIQVANTLSNRKIVLFQLNNNDHQVHGFGTNSGVFRFQIDASSSNFVFYNAIDNVSSNELMRLTGTGYLLVGGTTPLARIVANGGVQNVVGSTEESCIRALSSTNAAKIELQNTSASGRLWEIRSVNTGNFDIVDRSTSSIRLTVDTTGTLYANQSHASYYTNTSASTLVPTTTSFFKANWGSASSSLARNFTIGSSRLTYTGISPAVLSINVSLTATTNGAPGANGEVTTFAISRNGVNIATISDILVTAAAGIASVSLNINATAIANDFFELWVAHSTTANRTVTIQNLCYTITSISST